MNELLQDYGYSQHDVAYYIEHHSKGGLIAELSGFGDFEFTDKELKLMKKGDNTL